MKELRIRAILKNGFISSNDWSPMIDGILAYASQMKKLGFEEFALTQALNQLAPVDDLPLKKTEGEDWQYCVSLPIYTIKKSYIKHLHRRFNVEELERYGAKPPKTLQVTKGGYRNARLAREIRLTPYVDWYVIGDQEQIESLLQDIDFIGKNRGSGHGEVERWEIEENLLARDFITKHSISLIDNGGLETDWGIRPPHNFIENKRRVFINAGVKRDA